MTDLNDDLKEWNDTITEGEQLSLQLKKDAMKRRGWSRAFLLSLARFTDRWVERGERWRNSDILGRDQ